MTLSMVQIVETNFGDLQVSHSLELLGRLFSLLRPGACENSPSGRYREMIFQRAQQNSHDKT